VLTERYVDAFGYAAALHAGDTRKERGTPYLGHLLAVSALVIDHAGTEDQAVAALLHDAAEDHGGESRLSDVAGRFGSGVADIVRQCSDSLLAEGQPKQEWWTRKVAYVARFDALPPGAPSLLVAGADKLDNARSVLADYRLVGEALWSRFNAASGRAGQRWYYTRMAEVLAGKLRDTPQQPLADELGRTVVMVRDAVVAAGAADLDTLERELEEACARERAVRSAGG
jgi:hypothetical protein